jgi:hypothetical protein
MNAKMKVLSLALIGLCGYAGSALAGGTCPAGPAIVDGGAWTAVNQFQGTAVIATPGLDGSQCRLDSAFNTGASGVATATVQDDTPAAEPRYRGAFMVNLDALTAPTITRASNIFSGNSSVTGSGIKLSVFGSSGAWFLGYKVTDGASVYSNSLPLQAGANHVEFDLQIGATGSITMWVNNNVEANPTAPPHTVNNSADLGIDTAFLGLAAPSAGFATAYAGMASQFDSFDSRRSTFIGF